MSTVKVKIDAANGLMELEGDREFVSAHLEKLLPLLSQQVRSPKAEATATPPAEAADTTAASGVAKKARRIPKRAPAGSSCRDRILVLRNAGFFKEKQSGSEIVKGLALKGWTHNVNQAGAALTTMFGKGEIQRTKDGDSFKYFWDR